MNKRAPSGPAARVSPDNPEEISVEIPKPIERHKSGRIVGLCPEVPDEADPEGVHCWKFEPLPGQESHHDFLLMIFLMELGPLSLFNAVVPLDDGGVKHLVKFMEFKRVLKTSLIKKIKQSHGNFGVVSIGRMTAKTYYSELETLFIGERCLVKRFDARGDPVGDYEEISPNDFPPFPAGPKLLALESSLPPEEAIRLVSADDYRQGLSLHYARWEEQRGDLIVKDDEGVGLEGVAESVPGLALAGDDDDEADDRIGLGFVSVGSEAADTTAPAAGVPSPAPRKKRQPGIHIEFVRHTGNPSHVAALFWFKPQAGRPRFLFGDWCTQISFHQFIRRVIEKKKKSFFGSKKKITIIRNELLAEGVLCKPIP